MTFWKRLAYLWPGRRRAAERDIQEELRSIAAMAEPGELGNLTRAGEDARATLGWTWLEHFGQDIRYACRVFGRSPAFVATVVLSLALGIGANTALFTAVNSVLLQTIDVPNAHQMVRIKWAGDNDMVRSLSDYGFSELDAGRQVHATVSFPIYQRFRAVNQTMTDLTAFAPMDDLNVIVGGKADFATAVEASGSYFRTLGLNAALGRTFNDTDDAVSASPVAVISDSYWRARFGADPTVINRVVLMNNVPVAIIGVLPSSFHGVTQLGSRAPEVTVPLAFDASFTPTAARENPPRLNDGTSWWLLVMGRMKPGATIEQVRSNLEGAFRAEARAGLEAFTASLTAEERQSSNYRQPGSAMPSLTASGGAHGTYDLDTRMAQSAQFLSVVVVIVLLIVCANVANLLLSRATTRAREIATRLSMGASRGRLVRQLLAESLVLSCLGGLLGVVVGSWSRALLPFGQTATIDWQVATFVAVLSLLTGIAFGLAPALRATRVDLAESMKEANRSVTGSRSWLAKTLLVAQVALSLVLLVGAGLFLRTLNNLRRVDVGFDPTNLLMLQVNPQLNGYDAARIANLYGELHDRLAALPGIRSAALTRTMLLSGSVSITGIWAAGSASDGVHMYTMVVSPDFFDTMGIRVLKGRGLTNHDTLLSPRVAVINEAAARALFQGDEPLGRRVGESKEHSADVEIVGLVHDTKYSSVRDVAPPTMYTSYRQGQPVDMAFVLRTLSDPTGLTESVREAVRQADPKVPISFLTTQADQLESQFAQERLFATAYSLFGGLALLLACIGLFGLMSYTVARRTTEIGLRMALGAQRLTVVRMIFGETLVLVVVGIGIGMSTAVSMGHLVAAVLFGVTPNDSLTLVGAIGLVLVVSLLAGYLPARRASLVDPMVALHES